MVACGNRGPPCGIKELLPLLSEIRLNNPRFWMAFFTCAYVTKDSEVPFRGVAAWQEMQLLSMMDFTFC